MNLTLSLLTKNDSKALLFFEKENKEFFEKMVPARPDSYFEFGGFEGVMDELLAEQSQKTSLLYLIKNESGDIVGRMNLVDIDWRRKSGEVGYRVGEQFTGKGAAARGLVLLINEAEKFGIYEIRAKTTVNNIPSQKVLEKCGFKKAYIDEHGFTHYEFISLLAAL